MQTRQSAAAIAPVVPIAICVVLIGVASPAARGGCAPKQIAQLFGCAAEGDLFGNSIAVWGDTAVVGAFQADREHEVHAGHAYIFVRDPSDPRIWMPQAMLTAPEPAYEDQFGNDVALSGDTAVVAARFDDHDGGLNAGSVHVFVRVDGVWVRQCMLTAADAAEHDVFGDSVAISGDTAVIGASGDDDEGSGAGSAYVFTRTGETWTQRAKLTASDAAAGDEFGTTVAIHGDIVVVGMYRDDHGDKANAGSAYVFSKPRNGWDTVASLIHEDAKLIASDAEAGDEFGVSVAIGFNTVLIGAHLDDRDEGGIDAGSAYIFLKPARGWSGPIFENTKLTAPDAEADDRFGFSVDLSGDTATVGAHLDDHAGGLDAGSAHIFIKCGEEWVNHEKSKLVASDAAPGDVFGWSLALSEETALVGARLDDHWGGIDAGSAYIFNINPQPICPGDLDCNGVVNGFDLALLLGQWTGASSYAPCPPHAPADLSGDCKINGIDLERLLGAWGPCP